jgi:hypothetical protein
LRRFIAQTGVRQIVSAYENQAETGILSDQNTLKTTNFSQNKNIFDIYISLQLFHIAQQRTGP